MLRAIIIDDEESGIDTLKILVSRNSELMRVVAATQQPEEGIRLIDDYRPDAVFLDISMPTMNGFEVLNQADYKKFKLIFTTAHKEFAIEAIKSRAFDYLLKPIGSEDFKRCLEQLKKEIEQKTGVVKTESSALIEIQLKDGIQYLKQKEIIRLEASRSYTVFYMENGVRHVASRSLREFEEKLDPTWFFRCHKSHLVNLLKVQKFVNHNGFYALMSDGSLPDISKNCKDVFLERLKTI